MAYIYKIINDVNQKIYIGKTEFSIEKRFKEHCNDAFSKRCEKRPLYSAMRKYGVDHFYIFLIEETNEPEERERFWIQYYQSFKYGYNATLGGDGKKYIDYDLVIATYKELKEIKLTAKKLNIDPGSVHNILVQKNIPIKTSQEINKERLSKSVNMYEKSGEYIRSFSSMADAARFLIDNKYSNCKLTTIRYHISEVCQGKRKSAAGFIWKFNN